MLFSHQFHSTMYLSLCISTSRLWFTLSKALAKSITSMSVWGPSWRCFVDNISKNLQEGCQTDMCSCVICKNKLHVCKILFINKMISDQCFVIVLTVLKGSLHIYPHFQRKTGYCFHPCPSVCLSHFYCDLNSDFLQISMAFSTCRQVKYDYGSL